jgi:tetrahydromethanopterin S-methyltransferase subunit G
MALTDEDKAWISERLEEVETRMLRAFRNFAHPVEARLRVQKAVSRSFQERLEALEDRVEFLEGQSSEKTGTRK